MLPGPEIIYQCPNCENLLSIGSLVTANTFGAKLYSDGKRIAPMFPDSPEITKCPICEGIFWLTKLKEIGERELWDEESEWKDVRNAEFLTLYEYQSALENKIYETKEDEVYLRQRLWWAFNDRVRNKKPQFISDSEEKSWLDNVNKLIDLLDIELLEQKIMIAELYRNLGDFNKCMEVINTIKNDEMEWIRQAFIIECIKENTSVVQLK
ncbi:hypothetical protein ACFLQ5_00320 [Bacteroidota bacterium]